jgi:hypothetical protein
MTRALLGVRCGGRVRGGGQNMQKNKHCKRKILIFCAQNIFSYWAKLQELQYNDSDYSEFVISLKRGKRDYSTRGPKKTSWATVDRYKINCISQWQIRKLHFRKQVLNIWSLDWPIMPKVRSERQGNFPTSTFLRNIRAFGHHLYFTQA